jgi:putative oxidoreductase
MKCSMHGESCTNTSHDWALVALRVGLGVVLVIHGYAKLFGTGGVEGFSGMLENLRFPAPLFFAYVVSLLEFVGGIMLIIGLWTKVVASLVLVQFLVILLYVKKLAFPQSDSDLLIFAMALSLVLTGAGMYSVDGKLCKTCSPKKT